MNKILILFLIGFSLSFTTSCLKKQNLTDDNLGPAIDPALLNASISKVVGDSFKFDPKVNEFSSYILTQKIQDAYSETVEQQDITIKSVDVTPELFTFNSLVTKINYSGGQTSQQSREWPWAWDRKPTPPPTPAQPTSAPLAENQKPNYLFMQLLVVKELYCYSDGQVPQTCHNLQVTDVQFPVPPSSAAQHNCADAYACFVNARKIEFDQLLLADLDRHGKPKRNHIKMVVSDEVPFLSKLLQYCQRGLYEASSQEILLDYCYNTNGYAFGTQ